MVNSYLLSMIAPPNKYYITLLSVIWVICDIKFTSSTIMTTRTPKDITSVGYSSSEILEMVLIKQLVNPTNPVNVDNSFLATGQRIVHIVLTFKASHFNTGI